MFIWLTLRNSILTQDNLLRRGWRGTNSCYFCGGIETVEHMFISCSVARLIWSVLSCTFNFGRKPNSIQDMFGIWLGSFSKGKRRLTLVGIAAIIWTIWNTRNAICFENKKLNDLVALIHMIVNWINSWAILQPKQESREDLIWGAKLLERVGSDIFNATHGWRPGVASCSRK